MVLEIGDRIVSKINGEVSKGTIIDTRECYFNCIYSVRWDQDGWKGKINKSWTNAKFLEMDKQFYREKRLKQLLY